MIDIQQLKYFIRVYQTRNYTKAAESLYTSRQALRYIIGTFEKAVDTPLFIQQGKTLVPTPTAEYLYQLSRNVQNALAEFDAAVSRVANTGRRLRIGMVTGVHDAYTREQFYSRHQLRTADHCTYITADCVTLRQMLRDDELDAAYVISPAPTDDEFSSYCNRAGALYLMVNRSSPAAQKPEARLTDLSGVPIVSQGPGFDLHNFIVEQCRAEGFEPTVTYTTPSFFDITWQVNDDLGVSYYLQPDCTHYNMPNVALVPFREPSMRWYMLCLVKKNHHFAPSKDGFWDTSSGFPVLADATGAPRE